MVRGTQGEELSNERLMFFDNCVFEWVQLPPPEVDRVKARSPGQRLALNRLKRDRTYGKR